MYHFVIVYIPACHYMYQSVIDINLPVTDYYQTEIIVYFHTKLSKILSYKKLLAINENQTRLLPNLTMFTYMMFDLA